MIGLTYHELKALNPCEDSFTRVTGLLGGARKWNGRKVSATEARAAGATFEDILWAASAISRDDKSAETRLRLWMTDCAAHVLHIYEKTGKSGAPRDAIIASRQYARGEIEAAAMDAARGAAWAARATMDAASAARDAAMDAAWAARAAAGAAAWAAAWAAARAAARDAAWAAAWAAAAWDAAAWDARAARAEEEQWQFDRLIERLDGEPEDWPLPMKPQS